MALIRRFLPVVLVAMMALGFSCSNMSRRSMVIQGQFTGVPGKRIVLYELFPDSLCILDSAATGEGGKFRFRIKSDDAGFYLLKLDNRNFITLSSGPGETIEVTGDGNDLQHKYSVSGSEGSILYHDFLMFTNQNQSKTDSLGEIFMMSRSKADFGEIKEQLDSAYYGIFGEQQQRVRSFLEANAGNLVSLLVINRRFGPNEVVTPATDLPLFIRIDSLLSVNYPGNRQAAAFHKTMKAYRAQVSEANLRNKAMLPGSPEPDLGLPDASGNIIRLSSLSGKPHLVYFWGSWNAPCRRMNAGLIPIYNEFRKKGFEIYAIALDTQKEPWLNACRLDKATWIHVNDMKGLDSPAARACGITGIPTAILIGADGLVKARNIQPVELKTWLMTFYK